MKWTYRLEFVRCGKPNCHCARGGQHGPYWYAYQHVGGRLRKRYVGKTRQRYEDRDDAREPHEQRAASFGKMTTERAMGILGLGAGATEGDAKRRWRSLMYDHHPDRGGSNEVTQAINAAYTHLKRARGWV